MFTGSLESARAKCKLAQYLSDLSNTEELNITKVRKIVYLKTKIINSRELQVLQS